MWFCDVGFHWTNGFFTKNRSSPEKTTSGDGSGILYDSVPCSRRGRWVKKKVTAWCMVAGYTLQEMNINIEHPVSSINNDVIM